MKRNIIAILRGITPDQVTDTAHCLIDAGIDAIEVPLNSPESFRSIELLLEHFTDRATIGAGTVLHPDQVRQLAALGAHMVVSPNTDAYVIATTKAAGMLSFPGVMTPSECFRALAAGADGLKLFPAEAMGYSGLKAIRAVLPETTLCLTVGGVNAETLDQWLAAGANGCGAGGWLYKPGDSPDQVAKKAAALVAAYDRACGNGKTK